MPYNFFFCHFSQKLKNKRRVKGTELLGVSGISFKITKALTLASEPPDPLP